MARLAAPASALVLHARVAGVGGAFLLGVPFSVAICPFCAPALLVVLTAAAGIGSAGYGLALLLAFAAGRSMKTGGLNWLALFASTGTLICCALPILLVTLGAGATVAALTSAFPVLIALSVHKLWVFVGSGVMLALAAWMTWRPGRACPSEPDLAQDCDRAGVWNRRILTLAIAIWGIGFLAAFALYPLVRWWDVL